VLANDPEYRHLEDVENERIEICQWLREFAEEKDAYSQEISELMYEAVIRRSLLHIDKSKIHIDTGGLLRSFDKTFQERFDRHKALSVLDDRLRKSLKLDNTTLKQQSHVLFLTDASLSQFSDLFNEVKHRFLFSNEFGLDSYLSVRIRHGTLAGQIRNQLERSHLVTRVNAETQQYAVNRHWLERVFHRYPLLVQEKAEELLRNFSSVIDTMIAEVKGEWIHIKGPQHPDGLLNFDYSEERLLVLLVTVSQATYDEFINLMVQELWHRTEEVLAVVRRRIQADLKQRMTAALDRLAREMIFLEEDIRHSEFIAAVTACRTSLQSELDQIAEWFKIVDEGALPDYRLRQAMDTALEMVHKCYPNTDIGLVVSGDEVTCMGRTFTSFVFLYFILLENVARHSGLREYERVQVQIEVSRRKDNLEIVVENEIGDDTDIDALRRKLVVLEKPQSGLEALRGIRTEGGTGFYKLCKIIGYDLGSKTYDVSFNEEANIFTVRLNLETKGVVQ